MSPNNNNESEDFVFIDSPTFALPLRGGPTSRNNFSSQVEVDFVAVENDNPIIRDEQDTLMTPAPDEDKQSMVQIEYFEPMLQSAFPDEISQVLLMDPVPAKYQDFEDDASMSSSPGSPLSLLIKNAIILFECFFHFEPLLQKLGWDSVLYTVGKACELKSEPPNTLPQLIGDTFNTLREARISFLRTTKDKFVPRAEDSDVRELARLVNRYIEFQSEGPHEIEDMGYKNDALDHLWVDWQRILDTKGLRLNEDQRNSASEQNSGGTRSKRTDPISEVLEAATKLEGALSRLNAFDVSSGLTSGEKRLVRRVVEKATRCTERYQEPEW